MDHHIDSSCPTLGGKKDTIRFGQQNSTVAAWVNICIVCKNGIDGRIKGETTKRMLAISVKFTEFCTFFRIRLLIITTSRGSNSGRESQVASDSKGPFLEKKAIRNDAQNPRKQF